MKVEVDGDRLASGDLPPVCVVTGAPAPSATRVLYSSALKPWMWFTLGISPLLFAAVSPRGDLEAWLPLAEGVAQRVRRRRIIIATIAALATAATVIVVVAWLAGRTDAASMSTLGSAVAPVALGLGLLTGAIINRGFVDIVPVRGSDRVELRGVHKSFVEAVQSADVPK